MAKKIHKIEFPKGNIITYKNKKGETKIKIEYNKSYVNKFNNDLNKVQVFLDNKVIMNLQQYVKYKSGTMAKSIRLASEEGSGIVTIGVPYAHYQAYVNKTTIWNNNGKRGPRPFERMKADKKGIILKQVAAYSRRLNGQ